MKMISKYVNYTPYLYFIAACLYWFTFRTEGILKYSILVLAIPFIWQLIKPNKELNFTLGVSFVCLSSYLILIYLSDLFEGLSFNPAINIMIFMGIFVITNFIMSVWIVRNSLKRTS